MPKEKKYHYIYRTTCIPTGKYYVGMHSTDNLDDGYLGSGKILGYSRQKYGDENHKVEILEFLQSREELKHREKEIVNEWILSDPLNINLKYGGEGGWEHQNLNSDIQRQKAIRGNAVQAKKRLEDPAWFHAKMQKTSDSLKNLHVDGKLKGCFSGEGLKEMCERARSDVAKRKATFKERGHMQGEKNSQYGSYWVTDGSKPIKIKKEHLDEYITRGYRRGRK